MGLKRELTEDSVSDFVEEQRHVKLLPNLLLTLQSHAFKTVHHAQESWLKIVQDATEQIQGT